MRTILSIIAGAAIAAASGAGGDGFTTRIDIAGFPDTTFILARIHDGATYTDWSLDTICVIGGKAEIADTSRAADPARMYLFTDSGTITTYVQNGLEETISGTVADLATASLTYEGAPWSDDMMVFNDQIESLTLRLMQMSRRYGTLTPDERRDYSVMADRVDSLQTAYYKEHPNSWHALSQLESAMMDLPKDDLGAIYGALLPEQRGSRYGEAIKRYLDVTTIEQGDSLSRFNIECRDQHGCMVDLMAISEPYILIDFSQVYCGPCIAAAREIGEIKDRYAGKVAFVNFSCDESEQEWRKAIGRDSITWTSLYDGHGPGGPVCLKYKVNSYPTFFLFGPDRTLIERSVGYGLGMLDKWLKSLD